MPLLIFFVRHGARLDRDGPGSGRNWTSKCPPGHEHDAPLSAAGLLQVSMVGKYISNVLSGFSGESGLAVDADFFSSPLSRCAQTADAIAQSLAALAQDRQEAGASTKNMPFRLSPIVLSEGLYEYLAAGLFAERPSFLVSPLLALKSPFVTATDHLRPNELLADFPETRQAAASRVANFTLSTIGNEFPTAKKWVDVRQDDGDSSDKWPASSITVKIFVTHQFGCKAAVSAVLHRRGGGIDEINVKELHRASLARYPFLDASASLGNRPGTDDTLAKSNDDCNAPHDVVECNKQETAVGCSDDDDDHARVKKKEKKKSARDGEKSRALAFDCGNISLFMGPDSNGLEPLLVSYEFTVGGD